MIMSRQQVIRKCTPKLLILGGFTWSLVSSVLLHLWQEYCWYENGEESNDLMTSMEGCIININKEFVVVTLFEQ